FFFQAEDGIRDFHVTGVQTCALPILLHFFGPRASRQPNGWTRSQKMFTQAGMLREGSLLLVAISAVACASNPAPPFDTLKNAQKIGRASCRERGASTAVAGRVRAQTA